METKFDSPPTTLDKQIPTSTPGPRPGTTRIEVEIPSDLAPYLQALAKQYGSPLPVLIIDLLRNRALHREALRAAASGASPSEVAMVDQRLQSQAGRRSSARLPPPPRGGERRTGDNDNRAEEAAKTAQRKREAMDLPRLASHPCRYCRIDADRPTLRRGRQQPVCANAKLSTDVCTVRAMRAQQCGGFRG